MRDDQELRGPFSMTSEGLAKELLRLENEVLEARKQLSRESTTSLHRFVSEAEEDLHCWRSLYRAATGRVWRGGNLEGVQIGLMRENS